MNNSDLLVPPVKYEELQWIPKRNPDMSKRELVRQTGTYQSAITLPIAEWDFQITADLSADLEEAIIALQDFEQHASSLLPPESLSLGPLASILLRTESASSSQIEQLTSSAKQLALAEIDQGKSNAITILA